MCQNCQHPAMDHSNLAGCMSPGCRCTRKRKAIQAAADAAATTQALAAVETGTDPKWRTAASDAVAHLASLGAPFTTDDVWDHLADTGVEHPREPRALGPIMRAAAGPGGLIRLEGYGASRRRHGSLLRSYVGTGR